MFKTWVLAARPKTLPASISPIILGSAIAYTEDLFRASVFFAALICAMALQVSVNFANDWSDAVSGVDGKERLGPVRVVQSGLVSEHAMRRALLISCSVALISGLVLVAISHPILLVFGALSLLGVFAYSSGPYPLASHGLGEVTVFLFFGWLAVVGTVFAHGEAIPPNSWGYASVVGCLSAAIMLVNNLRDIPTDAAAGKRTLAVILGDPQTRLLYAVLLIFSAALHLLVASVTSFWMLIPLLAMAPMMFCLIKSGLRWKGRQLNTLLAQTAQLELLYCVISSGVLIATTP